MRNLGHKMGGVALFFCLLGWSAGLFAAQTDALLAARVKLVRAMRFHQAIADPKLLTLVERGDRAFARGRFEEAATDYRRLRNLGSSTLGDYASFKLAWCAFQTDAGQRAVELFRAAAKKSDHWRTEALRDLALLLAERDDGEPSTELFAEYGIEGRRDGLETMAAVATERSHYGRVLGIEEKLLALDLLSPRNPVYELAAIRALDRLGEREQAVERLFRAFPLYDKGSRWFGANQSVPRVTREAWTAFEEAGRRYAKDLLFEAERRNVPEAYAAAREAYQRYLKAFPATPYTAELRMSYAGILSQAREYLASAEQFVQAYHELAARALAQDALTFAVSALDAELNLEREQRGLPRISSRSREKLPSKPGTQAEIPVALDHTEGRFTEVATELRERYPHDSHVPDLLYEQGYLFYLHRDLEHALPLFQEIWQRHSTTQALFEGAAELSLDLLERHRDYERLSFLCRELLGRPGTESGLRNELASTLRRSETRRIDEIERRGELRKAAAEYLTYVRELGAQDPVLWESALFKAGSDFTRAGAYSSAIEAEEEFLKTFSASPRRAEVLWDLGKNDEWVANPDGAARALEAFADLAPFQARAGQTAVEAWRWAGIYYAGTGKTVEAERALLKASADPEARKELLELYARTGAFEKAIAVHRKARAEKGISEVERISRGIQIAELAAKIDGKPLEALWQQTFREAREHEPELRASAEGTALLGKLYFRSATLVENEYYTTALGSKRKTILLESLAQAFSQVSPYGGEWELGALYRTGLAYERMAREVTAGPLAAPFRDKAKVLAVQCLEKGTERGLLSRWVPRCYALASRLDRAHYPGFHSFYLAPVQTALLAPSGRGPFGLANGRTPYSVYPYFSSLLFRSPGGTAMTAPATEPVAGPEETRSLSSEQGLTAIPEAASYELLAPLRRTWIARQLDALGTIEPRPSSFAYLNLLRLEAPDQAIEKVKEAIGQDPENPALHNLLGLAYLDSGKLAAARITWLGLLARGNEGPAIWNNLGVVAYLEGRELDAIEAFRRAGSGTHAVREAWLNLGSLALKYHSPAEANRLFERSGTTDAVAELGAVEARLQAGEGNALKERIDALVARYEDDPVARLVASHFLMDVEGNFADARRFLREYLDAQVGEGGAQLQRALQEASPSAPEAEILTANHP